MTPVDRPLPNKMFQNKAFKKLNFWISDGDDGYGKDTIVFTVGCRPATKEEIVMWELLMKVFKKTGKLGA